MAADELHDIADLVAGLDESQLDTPSLCEGWRVRDVAAHIAGSAQVSLPQLFGSTLRNGFSIPRTSYGSAVAYAGQHTAAEMAAALHRFADDYASGRKKDGLARIIKPHELQLDNLIHEQDMRYPLDLQRRVPEERLLAALASAPVTGSLIKCKQRAAGLRLEATDVDWQWGSGPEVRGAATDLLLALGGRPAGLAGLSGDGVSTLAGRVKAG